MPGITNPAEEYFKDGLWGWVTDQWKKLIGDDAGHLQVDVVESGLPDGAATSANQTTMITALQLIDDLRAALDSIGTDELLVNIHEQDVDVEVKQTTPADLTPGVCGWDGSAWRKLPLLFGYSDRWAELAVGTAAGTGHATAECDAIPEGYVYVIQSVSVYHNAGANKEVTVNCYGGGVNLIMFNDMAAVSGVWYPVQCEFVLKKDDQITAYATAPGDGKICYLRAWGYKMKIAE